jgi:hypothetical protein
MLRHCVEDLCAEAFAALREVVQENPDLPEIGDAVAEEIHWIKRTVLALLELSTAGGVGSFAAERLFEKDRAGDHSCVLVMLGTLAKQTQAADDLRDRMLDMLRVGVDLRRELCRWGPCCRQTWT